MFPLGTWEFILRDDGPVVIFVHKDAPVTHVDHRFDGEDHAWNQQHTATFLAIMHDVGVFMKCITHPMSTKVSHDGKTVLMGMLGNRISDVANKAVRMTGIYADLQTFLGHIHESLLLWRRLSYNKHTGSIGIVTVKNGRHINVDDITFLQCDANLPVGVFDSSAYSLQETVLQADSTIFLYTDGLNEAENSAHMQFGQQRMVTLVETLQSEGAVRPEKLVERMRKAVKSFVENAEQSDDLTMLAIQRKK